MKNFIKNHWQLLIIILAGIGMFFVYAWFPIESSRDLYDCQVVENKNFRSLQEAKVGNQILQQQSKEVCKVYGSAEGIYKFNSPDETLNYFFTLSLSKGGHLYYSEPLENIGNNLIRPRSVNVIGNKVMPGSFMGMYIIYGSIARLLSNISLLPVPLLFYLTAFFAVIGIIFFYLLIALIFNKNIALISGLLAYIMPAWMYFSSRVFFHNILFVSLLIIGIYLLLRAINFNCHPGDQRQIGSQIKTKDPIATLQGDNKNSARYPPASPSLSFGGRGQLPVTSYLLYTVSGFFIGLALITRTSEIGWVALVVLLILIFNWKKFIFSLSFRVSERSERVEKFPAYADKNSETNSEISRFRLRQAQTSLEMTRGRNWLGFLLFITILFLTFIPVFAANYQLYGAPLSVGYNIGLTGDFAGLISQRGLLFKLLVSPFGIDFQSIAINGYNYLLKFFWYFSLPSAAGLLIWLFRCFVFKPKINSRFGNNKLADGTQIDVDLRRRFNADRKKQLGYLVILFLVSCYLLFYYGSWQIVDRIDEQTISIGTSYVRYFLPIYLGMIPFIGILIYSVINFIKYRKWPKSIITFIILILLTIPSFQIVFWQSDESLVTIRNNIQDSQAKLLKIQNIIPTDAIIVLGFKQADKIFFPEYKRLIPELAVPYDYESLANLSKHAKIYYYHYAPKETIEFISRRDFEPFGLRIQVEQGEKIYGEERLYKIK